MRFCLSWSSILLAAAAVAACSTDVEDASEPPPDDRGPAPLCIAASNSVCAGALGTTLEDPPREGAILWAKAPPDTAGASLAAAKLAVDPDGTLRRTPVLRNFAALVTPPRGLVRARIAEASLARLRADVEAARSNPEVNARAFFGPRPSSQDLSGANVLELGAGSACFLPLDRPSSSCVPDAVRRLHADVAALLEASERLWRDARSGTVSLSAEIVPRGRWPLAEDVSDGTLALTQEEWSRVGATGVFRLDGGDFVYVHFATANTDGGELLYVSRVSAVTLDESLADVRGELLANVGRYEDSQGAWLGVPLEVDRFLSFKNREIAIVPASAAGPERLYALRAIETFDLEAEPPIVLP